MNRKIIVPEPIRKNKDMGIGVGMVRKDSKELKEAIEGRDSLLFKKREQSLSKKHDINNEIQYQTDDKNNSGNRGQYVPPLAAHCPKCTLQFQQFITKKQIHSIDRSTQTSNKPFIIDLIQERVQEICEQNSRMSQLLQQKENELMERQEEVDQVEQKLTSILYSIGQQVVYYQYQENDLYALRRAMRADTETPAYIKALLEDTY